jgi:hypothetical protein
MSSEYGKSKVLVTTLPVWIVYIPKSQFEVWGSPSRILTRFSKKKTWKGLMLRERQVIPQASAMRRLVSLWSD